MAGLGLGAGRWPSAADERSLGFSSRHLRIFRARGSWETAAAGARWRRTSGCTDGLGPTATTRGRCAGEEKNEESKVLEFSEDEEILVAKMYKLIGQRWSLIAGRIPGRTAEEIEKYWTTRYSNSE
ncbi:uncharacterized protein A4U43_C07F37830 [Asparagus officinalis]|uniref:Uncharacterized protein n=1 Tax=Asparagus officinalis TaxID=4686 RepID=A0A5P1EHU5_ASPOF|nr:uncharacterized protein A4U43_C07F37830 [Asparagus officinalis]